MTLECSIDMYQDMLPTTTLTLTMILQDPGDNEGLCPLMILIKALSITGQVVYHGNVGFGNWMGEMWGRQGTTVSYVV